MRRRFFVDEIRLGHAAITGDDAHHLTRVLRVEAGQRYEISDNRSVYLAEVESARKSEVLFRTLEKLPPEPDRVRITLCCALFKFDHLEWMIEKATELGVDEIRPFVSTRSERGLDRAAAKRIERWRRIALEASQQCRRARLPEIHEVRNFDSALQTATTHHYFLDEAGSAPILSELPVEPSIDDPVALLLGPEGGWTDAERDAILATQTWRQVSLGPLILRAETAALSALAIIGNHWLARSAAVPQFVSLQNPTA